MSNRANAMAARRSTGTVIPAEAENAQRVLQGHLAVIRLEGHNQQVVQKEIEAEREGQRGENRRSDHFIDEPGLQGIANQKKDDGGDGYGNKGVNAEVHVGEISRVRAYDDERPMKDVDDVQHAPNEREARGNAGVQSP